MTAVWPAVLAFLGAMLIASVIRTLLNKNVNIGGDDWISKKIFSLNTRYWLGRYDAGVNLLIAGAVCVVFAVILVIPKQTPLPVIRHLTNAEQRASMQQYRAEAHQMSTAVLSQAVVDTSGKLLKVEDLQLSLKETAYETELYIRKVSNSDVTAAHDALLTKYGPCYGFPEGDCKE